MGSPKRRISQAPMAPIVCTSCIHRAPFELGFPRSAPAKEVRRSPPRESHSNVRTALIHICNAPRTNLKTVLTFVAERSAENALAVPEVLLYSKAARCRRSLGLLRGRQRSINTVRTYPSRHLFIPTPYIGTHKVEYTLQRRD